MTSRGVPTWPSVVREGVLMARSQPVASSLVAFMSIAVCASVLATTGQSAAAERDVLARIDDAGTRSVVATDVEGRAALTGDAVARAAALSDVEWAVGVGPVFDGRNPALGKDSPPVSMRALHGEPPPPLRLSAGRWPRAGEIVVGSAAKTALGLEVPAGGVRTGRRSLDVVGAFDADEPLEFVRDGGLVAAETPGVPDAVRSLHLVVERPDDVESVAGALRAALDPADPASLRIETSAVLGDVRRAVAGELGSFSRQLVLLVLAVGLLVTGLTVYGSVTMRRKDFGRRRALGASRSALVALVLLQTTVSAVGGTVVGAAIGLGTVLRLSGSVPPWRFVLGLALMTVLTAVVAAITPAIVAALRDPVRILRVP